MFDSENNGGKGKRGTMLVNPMCFVFGKKWTSNVKFITFLFYRSAPTVFFLSQQTVISIKCAYNNDATLFLFGLLHHVACCHMYVITQIS